MMFRSHKKKILTLTALSPLLFFIAYFLWNLATNNTHTVIPGEIYRSAQVDKDDITDDVHAYHIKSIINLRGANPSDAWYQKEIKESKALGLRHYNVRLSSKSLPTIMQLHRLVHIIETAPKPILIHCAGGADRTGLASAMSLLLLAHPDNDAIVDEISWQYDVISPKTIGYQVFQNYFQWVNARALQDNRASFLEWMGTLQKLTPHHGWYFT